MGFLLLCLQVGYLRLLLHERFLKTFDLLKNQPCFLALIVVVNNLKSDALREFDCLTNFTDALGLIFEGIFLVVDGTLVFYLFGFEVVNDVFHIMLILFALFFFKGICIQA